MKTKTKTKQKTKLRVGDTVSVIAGKEKGKQGKIIRMLLNAGRAIVEGVNEMKRHRKPSQVNPQGGIISEEASIHLSNLMVLDPTTQKPTRIGSKRIEASAGAPARKVRVAKSSGATLDASGGK
jgi:large subunit ribosomal protein L24